MQKDADFQPPRKVSPQLTPIDASKILDTPRGSFEEVLSELHSNSKMSRPVTFTSGFTKSFRRQAKCQCASLLSTQTFPPKSARSLTTSSARRDEGERYGNRGRELRTGPRWQSTPPRMMAPVRSKPPVENNDFQVNEDPERLDKVYDRVLGKGGHTMLTDEVKWLAVTHKSFDHGRRGFNDRLAFLGTRAQVRPCGHR